MGGDAMKKWLVLVLGSVAACLVGRVQAEDQAGKTTTTESLTIVQPGSGPEVRVITKEITATAPDKPAAAKPVVAPDTSVRKARVAVVPAVYAQGIRSKAERELKEKFGMTDTGVMENPGYTSYVIDALVNSRKLDVLERDNLQGVLKELDFGESDYADTAKVVRMGRMLNADYVVMPEIRYITVTTEEKEVPFINVKDKMVKGKFATSVRAVEVATGRIVSSNISEVEQQLRIRENKGPVSQQMADFIAALYKASAEREAASIVGSVSKAKAD
jgi:curli biogenesis system outer membrane secretion channel CsgG